MELDEALLRMQTAYVANPVVAVRSQAFIKILHRYIANALDERLIPAARRRGVRVVEEAKILGSHKPKDVDVAVIEPNNGPLMIVGVRSQMSSIGKNVLTYYQDIVGEAISLQDRFPLAVYGYAYLHPSADMITGQGVDHERYSRMYRAISGRDGRNYRDIRGVYDQFAYLVPDFSLEAPTLRDEPHPEDPIDLRMDTFVDRLVSTFRSRNVWMDVFE